MVELSAREKWGTIVQREKERCSGLKALSPRQVPCKTQVRICPDPRCFSVGSSLLDAAWDRAIQDASYGPKSDAQFAT
jgi:hypothetical protein